MLVKQEGCGAFWQVQGRGRSVTPYLFLSFLVVVLVVVVFVVADYYYYYYYDDDGDDDDDDDDVTMSAVRQNRC
jgi:hypothetical protein